MAVFGHLRALLGASSGADEELLRAITAGVELADPLIKVVPHFERKLATAARFALAYCTKLVAAIPGPLEVSHQAFGENPMVHAFFSRPEQIAEMLAKSQAVREFLASGAASTENFFALLGMRQQEKSVMGAALIGDRVRREVPQRLLYFSDHTLLELSSEADVTRHRVGDLGFASLAKSFAEQVMHWRQAQQTLQTQWELARAAGTDDQRRRELETQLQEASDKLQPHHVLESYRDWLRNPASVLRLEPVSVTVNRLGVVVSPGDAASTDSDTISFPELIARDRRRWILVLVRIRGDEARRALQAAARANRYMII